MIMHEDWPCALENLCAALNISMSRMAKSSGLSSSTLNKSKRYDRYGKPKWLNTGTLTKILNTFNITIIEFAKYFPQHED